jgi:hypothetical protein
MSLSSSLLWPPPIDRWLRGSRRYTISWPRNLTPKELKALLSLLKNRALGPEARLEVLADWAQSARISSFAVGSQSREKITLWLWGEVIVLVEEKAAEKEVCLTGQTILGLLRIYETSAAERLFTPTTTGAGNKPILSKLLKVTFSLNCLESLLLLPTVYQRFYNHPAALLRDERALLTWLKRDGVEFLPLLLTQLDAPEKTPWPIPALLSIPAQTRWRENLKQLLAHAHEFSPIGEMEVEIDGWLT